jgi:hypothetical protein
MYAEVTRAIAATQQLVSFCDAIFLEIRKKEKGRAEKLYNLLFPKRRM